MASLLKNLSLSKKNKRIDLSGLELPEPEVLERWQILSLISVGSN